MGIVYCFVAWLLCVARFQCTEVSGAGGVKTYHEMQNYFHSIKIKVFHKMAEK
jgi:hypothetical protein